MLLSVGELNDSIKHEKVIKAITDLNVYYIIVGVGEKKEYLEKLIECFGINGKV